MMRLFRACMILAACWPSAKADDSPAAGAADDTKVLQADLDRFAAGRGGILTLAPRKYVLRSPLRVHGKSTSIDGGANGFSNSPNAEHESETGSELCSAGDALHLGNHDPEYIKRGMNKLGAINLRNLYLWGPGSGDRARALYVDAHLDQSQLQNIHIGNYACALYADAVLDAPTIRGLDVIHCRTGVQINALAIYVRFQDCTIADNDGIGLIVTPESASRHWVMSGCLFVRNARVATEGGCNILWGGTDSSIVQNVIDDDGHHFYAEAVLGRSDVYVAADGLVLTGHRNIMSRNQFQNQTRGTAVVVRGHGNQITDNSFRGNRTDIRVDPGAADTVITQWTPFTLEDHGVRTMVNGVGRNAGDPDTHGDWSQAAKPEGVILHDILSGTTYQYSPRFPGGRITLAAGGKAKGK